MKRFLLLTALIVFSFPSGSDSAGLGKGKTAENEEHFHIFRMPRGISIKFLGKICFLIIVKFTKNQGFTPSLENVVLEKLQVGIKLNPSLLRVKVPFPET